MAQALTKDELQRQFTVSVDEVSEGTLVIYPYKQSDGKKVPRLAWMVTAASKEKQNGLPIRWMYVLAADTATPEVLDKWTLVHQGDISGTIQGWATPGLSPDVDYNPDAIFPTEDIYVHTSHGRQTTTDENGYFLFQNHDRTEVRANLEGPWVLVYDIEDFPGEEERGWFDPGVPGTLTFNPSQIENAAAELNAAKWVNDFRDYLIMTDPTYNLMDFQVLSWVNEFDTCNAYYYGSGIVFFQSGGGCVNTAYSTVITHEEGHWANDLAGSGNGPDGFGEGAADTWALYVSNTMNGNTNDPLLGRDFFGPGTYVRTGNNTRPFCGDSNPGCYGEEHDDGEVLMGALWKVRDWLNLSGPNTGNNVANSLLVSWFKQYNQSEIKSVIETQWLTLDDNDARLDNGSPHYCEIDLGFREQSFPGVDKPPKFAGVYWNSPYWPDGSCQYPFTNVMDALQSVSSPAEVHIVGHTYDEPTPLTITKTVTLRAKFGSVTIK
jgi:hypothetical protein